MKIVSCEHFFKLKYYKMKLSLRLLLLLPFILVMVGCPADDTPSTFESRPYSEVHLEDIAEIEDFMDTHFMTVDADYNVTFTKITGSTPGTPISAHPDLTFKTVSKGGVDHKLYFIKLQEGLGNSDLDTENDNPTRLDSIYSVYKGYKTDLTSFDEASSPVWFQLQDVIQGWQEIFPEFKIGTSVTDINTGLTTYSDFGAGVMFVPSGLAYFSQNAGSIGSYTPIIFNFKLMKVRFKDHDGDKILSKVEYGGPTTGTALDTDGDGKPDYADFDDDNDGKLTKNELSEVVPLITKTNGYYDFNDIPDCNGVRPAVGKRKHLNSACN
jgi:FKBP-type peptidyl-prolyl cis-trans isomerase FkpA